MADGARPPHPIPRLLPRGPTNAPLIDWECCDKTREPTRRRGATFQASLTRKRPSGTKFGVERRRYESAKAAAWVGRDLSEVDFSADVVQIYTEEVKARSERSRGREHPIEACRRRLNRSKIVFAIPDSQWRPVGQVEAIRCGPIYRLDDSDIAVEHVALVIGRRRTRRPQGLLGQEHGPCLGVGPLP